VGKIVPFQNLAGHFVRGGSVFFANLGIFGAPTSPIHAERILGGRGGHKRPTVCFFFFFSVFFEGFFFFFSRAEISNLALFPRPFLPGVFVRKIEGGIGRFYREKVSAQKGAEQR